MENKNMYVETRFEEASASGREKYGAQANRKAKVSLRREQLNFIYGDYIMRECVNLERTQVRLVEKRRDTLQR
ncbi:MAG: hypothetical protein V7K85_09795 [Nostoc sp.]